MTFLELCQKAAGKTGVITGTLPVTVVNQVGDLKKIVNNVNQAWRRIQQANQNWRWMRKEFTGTLTSPTARYTAVSFGITDFGRWYNDSPYSDYQNLSILDPTIGVADEGVVRELPWETFRALYLRGAQTDQRPQHYAISPANELCFGPAPDVSYTVNGEYFMAVETLEADADVPALPEEFHDLIWMDAAVIFSEDDEAFKLGAVHTMRYERLNSTLHITQLPPMKTAMRPPPLA